MNEIIATSRSAIVPAARVDFSTRVATMADVPFMDSMQKKFGKQLGYFPTKQFEGYVSQSAILIAEEASRPIGYVISKDRYLKRDELGVVYQLCVAPGTQRKLVGASLIAEVFRRSSYGCRLYCCWCAQDIDANYFWESLGFAPVAFRAGSAKKKRVHIFWQRRVHADDVTTPYWYPCNTSGGALGADRLVFPIPPGVHWKDVQAVDLPREEASEAESAIVVAREPRKPKPKSAPAQQSAEPVVGGFTFQSQMPAPAKAKKERPPKPARKINPKLVKAARELRDRWMDELNQNPQMLLGDGKYDVARLSDAGRGADRVVADQIVGPTKMLAA